MPNAPTAIENKKSSNYFRITPLQLDGAGALPDRFMLMQTGNWPNSVKGNFSIGLDDLTQIKQNFDNGVGFPTADASTGLAIDFKHDYLAEAAGWIKGLELVADGNGGGQLFANPVEWSDVGQQAVAGGRFKCVSPSGYFGKKGERMSAWPNPTNLKETVKNVLDGAALTNFPFLRGMSPVRASASDDKADNELDYDKVLFISENKSQQTKGEHMTIDEVRVIDREALTVPQLDFLVEHKSELSAEELTKFKLDAVETPAEGDEQPSEDEKATLAAIKDGSKKVVDANSEIVEKTRLDALEATAAQYQNEKAETVVEAHVKRGAIKQDSAKNWTGRLLAAATKEDREALEADLSALPDNKLISEELGTGENVSAGATARDQLHAIANEKIAAAAKDGKELLYGDALKTALRENADLQKQDLTEQGVK